MTTLPTALADVAALHPGIELEVVIGAAAALRPLADQGRVDLVFGDPSVMSENAVRWRRRVPFSGPPRPRWIPSPIRCRW